MPLRAFWTIVMEGRPTAFRSPQREELLPTLKQLQNRHPDTRLMWFQNGRYWHSPLDARRPRAPQRGAGPRRERDHAGGVGRQREQAGGFGRQRDQAGGFGRARARGPSRGRGPRKDRRR